MPARQQGYDLSLRHSKVYRLEDFLASVTVERVAAVASSVCRSL